MVIRTLRLTTTSDDRTGGGKQAPPVSLRTSGTGLNQTSVSWPPHLLCSLLHQPGFSGRRQNPSQLMDEERDLISGIRGRLQSEPLRPSSSQTQTASRRAGEQPPLPTRTQQTHHQGASVGTGEAAVTRGGGAAVPQMGTACSARSPLWFPSMLHFTGRDLIFHICSPKNFFEIHIGFLKP